MRKLIEQNILKICFTYLIVFCVYGMWGAQDVVSFDSEGFYSIGTGVPWYHQWIWIGRWGLALLKKVLDVTIINPYFSMSCFFLFFPISVIAWNLLLEEWSGKKSFFGGGLFVGLYVTNAVWPLQFAYRNQIEVISIVMAILPIGMYYMGKYFKEDFNTKYALISFLIITFSVGCYQSFFFVFLYGEVCFFFYYIRFTKGRNLKNVILRAIVFPVAIFVAYLLISKIFMLSLGENTINVYVESQFSWDKQDIITSLQVIMNNIKERVLGNAIFTCVYGVECIIIVVFIILREKKKKQLLLLAVCLAVVPFLLTIATATSIVDRSMFAYALGEATMGYIGLEYFLDTFVNRKIRIEGICVIVLLALIVPQLQRSTRLLYTHVTVLQHDYVMMSSIYETGMRIGGQEGDSIAFVGNKQSFQEESFLNSEIIGLSYFLLTNANGGSNRIVEVMRDYGYNVNYANEEQIIRANELQRSMPCWPQEGSVYWEDGLIVVKLSDN